jgi:hypothetical protein
VSGGDESVFIKGVEFGQGNPDFRGVIDNRNSHFEEEIRVSKNERGGCGAILNREKVDSDGKGHPETEEVHGLRFTSLGGDVNRF